MVLAQAHDPQLGSHIRPLHNRLLTLLQRLLLLRVRVLGLLLATHVEDDLLRRQFLQRALHLLDVGAAVVFLFTGGLGAELVLLDGAEAVESVLEVRDALTVQEAFGRSLVVPGVVVHALVNHIDRERLVLIVIQLDAMRCGLLVLRVALFGDHAVKQGCLTFAT